MPAKPKETDLRHWDRKSLLEFAVKSAVDQEFGGFVGLTDSTPYFKNSKDTSRKFEAMTLDTVRQIEAVFSARGKSRPFVSMFEEFTIEPTTHDFSKAGSVDPGWFPKLTNAGRPRTKPESLLRGQAALAWLDSIRSSGHEVDMSGDIDPDDRKGKSRDQAIAETVTDLLTVVCYPQGKGSDQAARLVAELGAPAMEQVTKHLFHSPLGWRAARVVTWVIRLRAATGDRISEDTFVQAEELLKNTHFMNPSNMYRGRALREEAAFWAPRDWNRWVMPALIERAKCTTAAEWSHAPGSSKRHQTNSGAPVRERMTAAAVLALRCYGNYDFPLNDSDRDSVKKYGPQFEELAVHLGVQTEGGLRVAGKMLAMSVESEKVPTVDQLFSGDDYVQSLESVVTSALNSTSLESRCMAHVAEHLRPTLKMMLKEACLTPDGIYRRQILEATIHGGLADRVWPMFEAITRDALERSQRDGSRQNFDDWRWLAEHAVFSVGFLASEASFDFLLDTAIPWPSSNPDGGRATRMTALMALGDMYNKIRDTRREEKLGNALVDRADDTDRPITKPELRAALYALAMVRSRESDVGDRTRDLFTRVINGSANFVLSDDETDLHVSTSDRYSVTLAKWGLARMSRRNLRWQGVPMDSPVDHIREQRRPTEIAVASLAQE